MQFDLSIVRARYKFEKLAELAARYAWIVTECAKNRGRPRHVSRQNLHGHVLLHNVGDASLLLGHIHFSFVVQHQIPHCCAHNPYNLVLIARTFDFQETPHLHFPQDGYLSTLTYSPRRAEPLECRGSTPRGTLALPLKAQSTRGRTSRSACCVKGELLFSLHSS